MKQVSRPLLDYLRDSSATPQLDYAVAPEAIALGAETWVFGFELRDPPPALRGPLVLRLFPADADPEQARFEHVVQNAMAEEGYPAPRSLLVCSDLGILGGPFLVMERIVGKMMLDDLFGGNLWLHAPRLVAEAVFRMPRAIARHQLELHAIDAAPLRRALEKAAVPKRLYTIEGWIDAMRERAQAWDLAGLSPGIAWLEANRPPDPNAPAICHGDFLPPNLLVGDGELAGVIDWSHLTLAHPEWDVANTRMRMAMNPLEAPRALQAIGALVRGRTTRVYERAYESQRPLDRGLLAYYEVLLSLWLLVMVGEHLRSGPVEPDPGRSPNLWLEPGAAEPLLRHCHALAGLALEPPLAGPEGLLGAICAY